MPRKDYEERQEARRCRYEDAAERAAHKSADEHQRAHDATAGIPMGQPILVGHHSERRHRRDLAKSDNAMRRSVEEGKKAAHYADKAEGVGRGGISSDDPEAPDKLAAKVKKLEVLREGYKRTNAAWRKAGRPGIGEAIDGPRWSALAEALGQPVDDVRDSMRFQCRDGEPYSFCKGPRDLKNLGARIRQAKKRCEDLSALAVHEHRRETFGEIKVEERADINRCCVTFPGKPDEDTRRTLKARGFCWNRTEGCWSRMISSAAWHWGCDIAKRYAEAAEVVKS